MAERGEAWARERREGVSTLAIARREGVTHQWVSRLTKPYGPFSRPGTPSPDHVAAWLNDRRSGRSAEWVAERYAVPVGKVRNATRAHGPFRPRFRVDGFVTITEAADHLAIPVPTMCHWVRIGFVPVPEVIHGRRLWAEAAFMDWVASADLETCPECGAMTRDQVRHAGANHP